MSIGMTTYMVICIIISMVLTFIYWYTPSIEAVFRFGLVALNPFLIKGRMTTTIENASTIEVFVGVPTTWGAFFALLLLTLPVLGPILALCILYWTCREVGKWMSRSPSQ